VPQLHIEVTYYAVLREQRGLSTEQVLVPAGTAEALYDQLRKTHGLPPRSPSLGVAVNDTLGSWDQDLRDGDRVAFLPPVAGG
jgi:molybdopterin converting factor small subunit